MHTGTHVDHVDAIYTHAFIGWICITYCLSRLTFSIWGAHTSHTLEGRVGKICKAREEKAKSEVSLSGPGFQICSNLLTSRPGSLPVL